MLAPHFKPGRKGGAGGDPIIGLVARIGPIELDVPFFQAGLAGYSDAAMRLVARRHGCPYCVTEAMLDQLLIRGGRGRRMAELDEGDHPVAGQLMGSEPKEMAEAAKILVDYGYDVIEVNLACPVKKIRRKWRGGHLLAAPRQAVAILEAVRRAVPPPVPTTVKLRRGWDDSDEARTNVLTILEAATSLGYAAATVHGRSVQQKYAGRAHWGFLAELVQTMGGGGISIFGSGDVWEPADVARMLRQTGVAAVAVARGCIGNPWFFEQARAVLKGDAEGAGQPPTLAQQRSVLLEHFALAVRTHGERRAGLRMRKFGIKFARHHPRKEEVARAFIASSTLAQWQAVIAQFYGAESESQGCELQGVGVPG